VDFDASPAFGVTSSVIGKWSLTPQRTFPAELCKPGTAPRTRRKLIQSNPKVSELRRTTPRSCGEAPELRPVGVSRGRLASTQNTMRKILLANLAAAAVIFSTGALLPNRANATPLDPAAGPRSALDAASPSREGSHRRRP